MIAQTPPVPYYAVIFTSLRPPNDNDFIDTANSMEKLAKTMDGYLGIESARDGLVITVSYRSSLESIGAWKQQSEHLDAQQKGRSEWYCKYKVNI